MRQSFWIFIAYKASADYPLNPFFFKIFTDFDEMKLFSAIHSSENKNYLSYVSVYIKTDDL